VHQEGIGREANVPQPIGKAFSNDYSFAEKVAMVYSINESLVSIPSRKTIRSIRKMSLMQRMSFFDVLDFPLITGDKNTILKEPNTAIITKRIAEKFFGDQNPINQTFRVQNKWDFKVTGILKDFPINTDRRDEIYLSYSNLKDNNAWLAGDSWTGVAGGMHCFVLLKPNVKPSDVDSAFPSLVKKYYNAEDTKVYHFKLQHISDFHFNRSWEVMYQRKIFWRWVSSLYL
jgi:hypothetical protein